MNPLDQLTTALAGRYEVEREIGAGGMATVYLARDLKHNRKVALKVLKPELGAVLGVERFLSEIQVTANLQHPNLLPLFDSGEANGLLFYVMPFVDGESLRARLDREKQLPVDEAVRIAVAIAGALDYAHAHGVIHRDLKPENILLQAGQPVIADFGIALAVSNAGGARVTQTGLSLGTPQYMSPEQATGDRVIDARSDIYSLSAMTYEMLVGDPPHLGSTAQAIVAKVLTERPPSVQVARPMVGDAVAYAVERGLEKLPADRWTSAGEFAEAMVGKLNPGATRARTRAMAAGGGGQHGSSRATRWALAVAGAVAVVATAAAAWLATRKVPPPVLGVFEATLPDSVSLFGAAGTKLALSTDGTQLVVVGEDVHATRALYLRRMDDAVMTLVRGTEGAASPNFSPDGKWLVFLDNNSLKKVPVAGGAAETIADSVAGAASWGEGDVVVVPRSDGSLWLTSPTGAGGRRIAAPDSTRKIFRFRWPEVLPGGKSALVTLDGSPAPNVFDALRLGVVDLSTGTVTELGVAGSNPHFVAPDGLVFGASGAAARSVRFSLRSLRVTGEPERLLADVWQGSGGAVGVAASRNGVLASHAGGLQLGTNRQIVAVSDRGQERKTPIGALPAYGVRISPDGRRVAIATFDPRGQGHVLIAELTSGAVARLLADSTSTRPEWLRDGREVGYVAMPTPGPARVQAWDRSAPARTVASRRIEELSTGPAGGYWAFRVGGVAGGSDADIWIARDDSLEHPRPLIATRGVSEYKPRISPNGRLIAFVSEEGGTTNVYMQPVPGPGSRVPVSIAGGTDPAWAPDGKALFYRHPGGRGYVMRAMIVDRPNLAVGARDSLFADKHYANANYVSYDVLPGGRELLMVSADATTSATQRRSVTVIMNWRQMLASAKGGTTTPER